MYCIVMDCFFIEPGTFDGMKRFPVFLCLDRSPVVTVNEVNSLCLTLFHLFNSCSVIFIDPKLRSQSNTNHFPPPNLNYICLIVDFVSVMAGAKLDAVQFIHSSHDLSVVCQSPHQFVCAIMKYINCQLNV